ncbi:MAG: hypothetical protein H0T89_02520 [Deltaproteobacteria bacterium]|nr:hypothetical protein [Deltaproteobacteria bacterium]
MAGPAVADTARDHATRGEALAREGRLTDAIDAFKAADQLERRASHACLIALAYMRRELWTQAELFLEQCHERARPEDPLPPWITLAEQQLAERLATAKLAAIELVVKPAVPGVQLTVSSFAPDESFSPRTIRLPLGRHLVTATTPGRAPVHTTVEVTDVKARTVVMYVGGATARGIGHRSRVPTIVTAAGAVTIAGGLAYHLFAFRPVRDELIAANDPANPDPERYDLHAARFDSRRTVTFALYGAGVATVITGVVLRYTIYRETSESTPRVAARFTNGGATVGLEWRR